MFDKDLNVFMFAEIQSRQVSCTVYIVYRFVLRDYA